MLLLDGAKWTLHLVYLEGEKRSFLASVTVQVERTNRYLTACHIVVTTSHYEVLSTALYVCYHN